MSGAQGSGLRNQRKDFLLALVCSKLDTLEVGGFSRVSRFDSVGESDELFNFRYRRLSFFRKHLKNCFAEPLRRHSDQVFCMLVQLHDSEV